MGIQVMVVTPCCWVSGSWYFEGSLCLILLRVKKFNKNGEMQGPCGGMKVWWSGFWQLGYGWWTSLEAVDRLCCMLGPWIGALLDVWWRSWALISNQPGKPVDINCKAAEKGQSLAVGSERAGMIEQWGSFHLQGYIGPRIIPNGGKHVEVYNSGGVAGEC
jgi:hypothetical protein